jgi:hypothetical protein
MPTHTRARSHSPGGRWPHTHSRVPVRRRPHSHAPPACRRRAEQIPSVPPRRLSLPPLFVVIADRGSCHSQQALAWKRPRQLQLKRRRRGGCWWQRHGARTGARPSLFPPPPWAWPAPRAQGQRSAPVTRGAERRAPGHFCYDYCTSPRDALNWRSAGQLKTAASRGSSDVHVWRVGF